MIFDPDDKMIIGMAEGSSKNIHILPRQLSFREFADFCSKPQQGGKHESYFTRGMPEEEDNYTSKSGREYGRGSYRHDSSIGKADFIIIDADNSEASPSEVHEQLKREKYAHFIYTSHSHGDNNNFRVVIPCEVSKKEYLVATVLELMKNIEGVKYVREMGVWSQAWYLPTRDDPTDEIFESYSFMDGTAFLEVQEETTTNKNSNGSGNLLGINEEEQTMGEMIRVITTGGEGMHHAMKSYSYGQIQDGVAPAVIIATLQGLMSAVEVKDARWQSRFDDIERLVVGAESPEDLVAIPEIEAQEEFRHMEFPPGLTGSLCQSVTNYSDYPHNMISIVTVLGLLSGVAGRRFNVRGSGLNCYFTLLMGTGEGKSVIDDFIQEALVVGNTVSGSSTPLSNESKTFVGKRSFTGAKSLMRDLKQHRCQVSVFTEAGFLFSSKVGDKAGLRRTILDLIGKSGATKCMQAEGYSDEKNNIEEVVAPCFSMVCESTPDIFNSSTRDGVDTGEITRMHVYRVFDPTWRINREKRFHIDKPAHDKLHKLIARCLKTQHDNDPDPSHFDLKDDQLAFLEQCKKRSIELKEEDPNRSKMLTRTGLKTVKIACLLTLFNHHFKSGMRNQLQIADECWDWAVKLHEFEMAGLEEFFKSSGGDDLYDVSMGSFYKAVIKIFNNGFKDKQQQVIRQDKNAHRIPLAVLRRTLRKNKHITSLSVFSKPGFDIVLEYLEKNKWCSTKVIENTKYVVFSNSYFVEGTYTVKD